LGAPGFQNAMMARGGASGARRRREGARAACARVRARAQQQQRCVCAYVCGVCDAVPQQRREENL
jgi:hypothetical protein